MGKPMTILVTGADGQVGRDVLAELLIRGHRVIGTRHRAPALDNGPKGLYLTMDITDPAQTEAVISQVRPDGVIHCAAWTAVDAAEEAENRERVFAVNAAGTEAVARACKAVDCRLLYLSTDYVFPGSGTAPWDPDCRDYGPLNVYGQSKLAGEQAVAGLLERYFIVRIAWVFGLGGQNFVKTMLRLAETHDTLRVVNDQIGAPTYTKDLARLLADMMESEQYGYYHATNEGGYLSWYDFACEIFRQAGKSTQVLPVTTEEYGLSRALRPQNSRLDTSKLLKVGFAPLPVWKDALSRYLQELNET